MFANNYFILSLKGRVRWVPLKYLGDIFRPNYLKNAQFKKIWI